jgi:hypothetical protein
LIEGEALNGMNMVKEYLAELWHWNFGEALVSAQ